MKTELEKLSDLSQVKKGDTIWTIQSGYDKVTDVVEEGYYPIKTEEYSYCKNGLHEKDHKYPSGFIKNPLELLEFKEREMMVSDGKKEWHKQVIVAKIKGFFVAYDKDYPINKFTSWKYAKEIETPEQPKNEVLEENSILYEILDNQRKILSFIEKNNLQITN